MFIYTYSEYIHATIPDYSSYCLARQQLSKLIFCKILKKMKQIMYFNRLTYNSTSISNKSLVLVEFKSPVPFIQIV